jgi:hypothetical protein
MLVMRILVVNVLGLVKAVPTHGNGRDDSVTDIEPIVRVTAF